MKKLEEFYANREMMAKYFSEDILKQKEAEVIQDEVSSSIKETMERLLNNVTIPLDIHIVYTPNKEVSVDISTIEPPKDETADIDYEQEADEGKTYSRSESIGFIVRFPDGTEVHRKNAKETMIATLKVIGLHKVAAFRGRLFKGFPLVSRKERTNAGFKCQELVDGWFIYTNMANDTKIDMLRQISDELGLGLQISSEDDTKSTDSADITRKNKVNKRSFFRLNGDGPFSKRELVLLAVTQYMMEHSDLTYAQIEQAFPKNLQGSYAVVRPVDWIMSKASTGTDHMNRYYMDEKDILTSADGVRFAVCKEWGDNFSNFVQQVEHLGWTVTED